MLEPHAFMHDITDEQTQVMFAVLFLRAADKPVSQTAVAKAMGQHDNYFSPAKDPDGRRKQMFDDVVNVVNDAFGGQDRATELQVQLQGAYENLRKAREENDRLTARNRALNDIAGSLWEKSRPVVAEEMRVKKQSEVSKRIRRRSQRHLRSVDEPVDAETDRRGDGDE